MSCVFCAVVAGGAEASAVHEEERVAAFTDVQPLVRGHLLVAPRRQVRLAALDDAGADEPLRVARRAAAAVRGSGLRCEGVDLRLSVRPRAELDEAVAAIRGSCR
jgi:histidine triad (HIT) family protein